MQPQSSREAILFNVLFDKRIMLNRLIANLNLTRHLHLGVAVSHVLLYPEFFSPQVFHLGTRQQLRLELFAYVPLFLFVGTRVSKSFRYGKSQYIPWKFFKQSDATDGSPNEELRRWMVADLWSSCLPTGFAGSRGSPNSTDSAATCV